MIPITESLSVVRVTARYILEFYIKSTDTERGLPAYNAQIHNNDNKNDRNENNEEKSKKRSGFIYLTFCGFPLGT